MKSQIIITVEHGEDTDSIQEFVETISNPNHDEGDQWLEGFGFDFKVTNTEVAVDIENAPAKTILPEDIFDAIRGCAIATENLSDSSSSIRESLMLQGWLDTHANWHEPKHKDR